MDTLGIINDQIPNNFTEYQTSYGDIYLDGNGNLAIKSDEQAILDILTNRIRTKKYEVQYDMNKGIPYFETIFANTGLLGLWRSYVIEEIERTSGVISVESLLYSLDEGNKKLSYTCQIRTIYGETSLNGTV
jgi:hypothetical protein